MLGRIVLVTARCAAAAVRPLERMALFSLKVFMTPRGPLLFFGAVTLLIATQIALIVLAPGPGRPALVKIALGLFFFALFAGYLRAFFAVRSETEGALAGIIRESDAETVEFETDVPDRVSPQPRFPGVLSLTDLSMFLLGLACAHTMVAAGLLEGGFGPRALDAEGASVRPSPADWAAHTLWATLGGFDLLDLGPRAGEPLWGLRYEWGWAFVWIALYRLALLGVLFSLAGAAFDVRRKVAIALSRPGLWWEKRQHLQRLGHGGFRALADALYDLDPVRREDAARMLGALGAFGEEAAAPLAEALRDTDPRVRERAAESLGALGRQASGATEALIEALTDVSPAVRRNAAAALGAVAVDDPALAYPAMAALAKTSPEDPDLLSARAPEMLAAVAKSLAELAMSVGGAEEAVLAAVDRLRGHPEPHVRQTAVEAYGQIRGAAQSLALRREQERLESEALRLAEQSLPPAGAPPESGRGEDDWSAEWPPRWAREQQAQEEDPTQDPPQDEQPPSRWRYWRR